MKIYDKFWHQALKRPYKLFKSVDVGEGELVIFLHGIGNNGHTWDPVIDLIDKSKYRVVAYDLLGFGQSPSPLWNSYNVREHAKSVYASLEKDMKKQKITIIGHSMGCLIASHIAWLYPNLINRLILYEPPLFADSPEFRQHARRKKFYFAFYSELLQRPNLLFNYSKLLARLNEGRALSVNPKSWIPFERSLKNTIMSQTAYNELKLVEVPTDIIYGKFDLIVTRKEVKNMLDANKKINFHLVNQMHDVNKRAGTYIVNLLNKPKSG